MRLVPETSRSLDSVLLLFLFALLVFFSPLTSWWAADQSPWFLPYLLWLGLLALIAWQQRRRGHHDL